MVVVPVGSQLVDLVATDRTRRRAATAGVGLVEVMPPAVLPSAYASKRGRAGACRSPVPVPSPPRRPLLVLVVLDVELQDRSAELRDRKSVV